MWHVKNGKEIRCVSKANHRGLEVAPTCADVAPAALNGPDQAQVGAFDERAAAQTAHLQFPAALRGHPNWRNRTVRSGSWRLADHKRRAFP